MFAVPKEMSDEVICSSAIAYMGIIQEKWRSGMGFSQLGIFGGVGANVL